jgi:hypothetical protein
MRQAGKSAVQPRVVTTAAGVGVGAASGLGDDVGVGVGSGADKVEEVARAIAIEFWARISLSHWSMESPAAPARKMTTAPMISFFSIVNTPDFRMDEHRFMSAYCQ